MRFFDAEDRAISQRKGMPLESKREGQQRFVPEFKVGECFPWSIRASLKEATMPHRNTTARRRPEDPEQTRCSTAGATGEDYSVSLTWLDLSHVSDRELEVIELYLGHQIDPLLEPTRRPKARGPPD